MLKFIKWYLELKHWQSVGLMMIFITLLGLTCSHFIAKPLFEEIGKTKLGHVIDSTATEWLTPIEDSISDSIVKDTL